MAFKKNAFSARVVDDPKRAAAEIVAMYERLGASQKRVAEKLDVSENTLLRWIRALEVAGTGLVTKIERVRKRSRQAGGKARPAQGWARRALQAKRRKDEVAHG
jgi:transposase-like protein